MSKLRVFYIVSLVIVGVLLVFTVARPVKTAYGIQRDAGGIPIGEGRRVDY